MLHNTYPSEFGVFDEEGLGDPLGEFSNLSSFNLLEFVHNDNTPLDSPDPSRNVNHSNNERNVQGVGNNSQHNSHAMFQNATRLPESPPITDISGAGSSGSPESNSDAPYSPENYPNYVGIHGNLNNNGLILGVPGMMAHELHQPSHGPVAHTITSPQNACFMSPYPPSQPTPGSLPQVSPPVSNSCHDNQQYIMNNGYSAGLFNILNVSSEGSINSQAGEVPRYRKRPRTENQLLDPPKFLPTFPSVGQAPVPASPIDCSYQDENFSQQVIKFSTFQEELWNPLYDINHHQLTKLKICVVADKGFNYSNSDGCFVNQKKNHFQISVNIEAKDENPPKFVKVNGVMHPIKAIKLAFCGVKAEMLSSEIQIKQSQTDRKPIPHDPVILNIHAREITKVTVPRLHFSETTLNNQRKNNRPNPDQKYFLLVVRLLACTDEGVALIQAQQSEKVIVRATNPGSFEPPESDVQWYRNGGTLVCHGPVAIGTDRTAAKLTVDGDIYITGQVTRPSDIRLKEDIVEKTSRDALEHLQQLRIVDFRYKPEVADLWGLTEEQRRRTGLIAQELQAVLPDAVRDIGTHLTIDESRIFYETVLAMQELCRLTGDLDTKIDDKVEEISQRLARYARRKKLIGSIASNLSEQSSGIVSDNKSCLSYSRTSLASTAPSITKESHERRKARSCRTHCHRPEPICHSKLTQGTIIALVAVMAACLIAMSALYVLDWHNRNYGYHHLYPPNVTPPYQIRRFYRRCRTHDIPNRSPVSTYVATRCTSASADMSLQSLLHVLLCGSCQISYGYTGD
ncbi:NDT80 / PhoG like DNA-binding [Parelaphostrongylus tenuis]|uniref:NDT80 / PhoG like DNA-binding n=1 Tax=Parelaphostrongylus tenuis TaxID=148309 RepID=A0AAD5QFT1_PARTN|nr:NDT80 / PhoG like DNA-binding [Parelaphostrongylus tenuis]